MKMVHLGACLLALAAGAFAAIARKGTFAHIMMGRVYVGATFIYCVSSFFLYPSTGQFTPFHAISIQNAAMVAGGIALPRLLKHLVTTRRIWQLRLMLYSYVALVVTGLRFAMPYAPSGNRVLPGLVFMILPACSWFWIERFVVPRWRAVPVLAQKRRTAAIKSQ